MRASRAGQLQRFATDPLPSRSRALAGIGFPVIITLLIPARVYWFPRIFTNEELSVLDSPTADSAAVLVSLGGPLEPEHGTAKSARDAEATVQGDAYGSEGLRRRGIREEEDVGGEKVVEDGLQRTTSIKRS